MKAGKRVFWPWVFLFLPWFWLAAGRAESQVPGKEMDFAVYYGKNWENARSFVAENSFWMVSLAREAGVDPALAVAVVFPELVRYDALRDRMELTLLKTLYTHYGREYADFSVGRFQIKPSCAEDILRELRNGGPRKLERRLHHLHRGASDHALRTAILRDMEDPRTQFLYVVAVIRILDRRFPHFSDQENAVKIPFYATAYNCGFMNSEVDILKLMGEKNFHTRLMRPAQCTSYAAIAEAYSREAAGSGHSHIP